MPAKKAAKSPARKTAKKQAPESVTPGPDPALNSAPVDKPPHTTVPQRAANKGPSTDEIARSAYLNYRRRVENNLPGNHESDWLEAENHLNG
jgi:hypothetical protein